jgi:hypothetical protein
MKVYIRKKEEKKTPSPNKYPKRRVLLAKKSTNKA